MRLIRWRQGMTITTLARNSGVSRQTIYDIENGARPWASAETMGRLARALGATIEELREPAAVA